MAGRRRQLGIPFVLAGALSALLVAGTDGRVGEEVEKALQEARRTELALSHRLGLPLRGMPALDNLQQRLASSGLRTGLPVLVRIFKQESELELWMKHGERFELFATYPICRWSGGLGPKLSQGDRQSPEGFYTVEARQLNANSRHHRAFNVGYPNLFDRAHARTGDFIMVHGGCSSIGCFAVTDAAVDEIWTLVLAALKGGQKRFQVQSFPFRLSDARLSFHSSSPWAPFWRDLKAGYDLFERDRLPPKVAVCGQRYVFAAGATGSDGSAPIEAVCSPRRNGGPDNS